MNTQRMLVLGVAAIAAGAAALLARGLLGGGTEKVKAAPPPPRVVTVQVLVAANNLQPGVPLVPASVRWQEWPKSAIDATFITHDIAPDSNRVIIGTVTRAPLVAGEPITAAKIVHATSAGIMAAMVNPGMRAVSIGISTETGAGGFILPNDRVDVVLTEQVSDQPKRFGSHTLLSDVRVLAVDQTFKEDNNQKVVLAKTATLELTPHQAEKVERAYATGTISLALRGLGDDGASPLLRPQTNVPAQANAMTNLPQESDTMTVIGYGVPHPASDQGD